MIIHCDLPGVLKENIFIDLENGMLTISGEKTQVKKEERVRFQN